MACTPKLNWRDVHLGALQTQLPCKPDNASRPVQLLGQTVVLEVAGCEAADALYAISRLQANDASHAARLLSALRSASLSQILVATVKPLPNSGNAVTSLDVQVDGKRPNGTAVQARLKWLLNGTEVYQIAAYANQLDDQQTATLMAEARLR